MANSGARGKRVSGLAGLNKGSIRFDERAVLPDTGSVSREEANRQAEAEYEKFAQRRRELAETDGMRQLEDAARELAKRKRTPPRRKGS